MYFTLFAEQGIGFNDVYFVVLPFFSLSLYPLSKVIEMRTGYSELSYQQEYADSVEGDNKHFLEVDTNKSYCIKINVA